jgi:hypothetical protein
MSRKPVANSGLSWVELLLRILEAPLAKARLRECERVHSSRRFATTFRRAVAGRLSSGELHYVRKVGTGLPDRRWLHWHVRSGFLFAKRRPWWTLQVANEYPLGQQEEFSSSFV